MLRSSQSVGIKKRYQISCLTSCQSGSPILLRSSTDTGTTTGQLQNQNRQLFKIQLFNSKKKQLEYNFQMSQPLNGTNMNFPSTKNNSRGSKVVPAGYRHSQWYQLDDSTATHSAVTSIIVPKVIASRRDDPIAKVTKTLRGYWITSFLCKHAVHLHLSLTGRRTSYVTLRRWRSALRRAPAAARNPTFCGRRRKTALAISSCRPRRDFTSA